MLGRPDGILGMLVGCPVGCKLGSLVGKFVGEWVGCPVGCELGSLVGKFVGEWVLLNISKTKYGSNAEIPVPNRDTQASNIEEQ